MKKILVAILCLSVAAAQAQKPVSKKPVVKKPTAPASSLKNLNDSASYAIGLSVANFYTQQGLTKINAAMVSKAITDVLNKKKPMIDETQANDVIMSCMNQAQLDKSKPTVLEGEAFLQKNKLNPSVKTTASGLQYEVIREGNGPKPSATDTVTVHYKGTLLNGTEFDNSYTRGEPATFQLNRVIPGWTEGVQLMSTGSKYKFYIPYALGYGLSGNGPIPGGSVLVFEVELISISGKK
ncbi:MAG TPA: FKBP-type peptidyl-prolyl cis-trans isomerase [Flavisolibacter sp.]|nr:FKBP-type peptidyl-prolyl cis-trans isomerase [Flavisolibacter sp.]